MTPERWHNIKQLVNSALAEDSEARTALLQQSCAEDFGMRIGTEALLSATRKFPDGQITPDEWQRIEKIFQSALELEPAKRVAYLAEACGDDEALRNEVESLLVYQGAAGGLIQGAIHEAAGFLPNETKARFTSGTTLNKRYRIIGLLGKGGMGEVYRADDLKLGQPVALKFLTEKLSQDKAMLARFHGEVSMAHRVTHPNVCRVHDIGDVTTSSGNLHFLSMEYVDGEDLSSLLRRIGRLPSDKAVEIATQLCAGLAAAHEAGVLHRDLKPANVMIDGKGRVRITDFGLAGFAEQIKGNEVMAGTPAYMSPEQFAGKEVTTKSDIYALGLVLYEIFTGKRVFDGGSLDELKRMHESSAPATPSSWVKNIDPLVERVILRCLEKDPAKRLSSAKQVADALPGGDPLAAALAMGETPSPEMVAAAGQKTGMKPMYAVLCLITIIAGLFVIAVLNEKALPITILLRQNSPEELAHKARELARQVGYAERPVDSAFGYYYDNDYAQYQPQQIAREKQWELVAKGQSSNKYWYRQSPRYLQSWLDGWIRNDDPPSDTSGMVSVYLDLHGRLNWFEAVPPQIDQPHDAAPPDWKPLFAAAELDPATLTSTEPQWTPLAACDLRLAWKGTHPAFPEIPVRVEAAAFHGKVVYFQIIWPWTQPWRAQEYQASIGRWIWTVFFGLFFFLSFGALLLAFQNFRHGRGDRRGAIRLAAFIFSAQFLSWLFGANHIPSISELFSLFIQGISPALLWAALAWVLYLALEPYVRKRWPSVLISWGRIWSGNLRDPLACRDLLFGVLCAITLTVIELFHHLAASQVYGLRNSVRYSLPGLRFLIASNLDSLRLYTIASLISLFLIFLLRIITRREWITITIFALIGALLGFTGPSPVTGALLIGITWLLYGLILLRVGFLAFAVTVFVQLSLLTFPITLHFSAWYTSYSLVIVGTILALAIYAFHSSLGGQKVFTGKLLEE